MAFVVLDGSLIGVTAIPASRPPAYFTEWFRPGEYAFRQALHPDSGHMIAAHSSIVAYGQSVTGVFAVIPAGMNEIPKARPSLE